jgi:uncharacterized protein (DUF2062 family)
MSVEPEPQPVVPETPAAPAAPAAAPSAAGKPASPRTFLPDEEHEPSAETREAGALDRRPRVISATSPAVGMEAEAAESAKPAEAPPPKRTWRTLLAAGLTPREVGIACGLGAAIGISPLPGLHMALAVFFAWLLRLNAPLVLLAANISFGPLLLVWYAAGIAIGREILTGDPLMRTWPALQKSLEDAQGFTQELLVLKSYLWSWFLGTTVLMVVCGPSVGVIAFFIAKSLKQGRETLTRRFHKH